MEDVAKPAGLTKRKGSSKWYLRQSCPKHLLPSDKRWDVWISLETSEYGEALKRVDGARAEAAARFNQRDPSPSPSHGITFRPRAQRPEEAHLTLLTTADALGLARSYFRSALQHLDANPVFPADLDRLTLQRLEQELDDREGWLRNPNGSDDEHPALAAEIGLLKHSGFRSVYDSEASELLREYLRRGMLQLVAIERARLVSDFTVVNSDPLFVDVLPGNANRADGLLPQQPATLTGVTVARAAERFLVEMHGRSSVQKTKDRYSDEVKHVVSFLGPDTAIANVRRAECRAFRDTFSRLPPNFARKLTESIGLVALANMQSAGAPVLAWHTLDKYLSALSRFMKWAHKRQLRVLTER